MFTIILIILLVLLIMFVHYISSYLYENDIKLVAVLVVIAGIFVSIFIVSLMMNNIVDFTAQKLNFFYK